MNRRQALKSTLMGTGAVLVGSAGLASPKEEKGNRTSGMMTSTVIKPEKRYGLRFTEGDWDYTCYLEAWTTEDLNRLPEDDYRRRYAHPPYMDFYITKIEKGRRAGEVLDNGDFFWEKFVLSTRINDLWEKQQILHYVSLQAHHYRMCLRGATFPIGGSYDPDDPVVYYPPQAFEVAQGERLPFSERIDTFK